MAKGRKKPPAMQSLNLAKPQFYYHSPSVDDHFLNLDALHSPGPAVGLPMHQSQALFDHIQKYGVAPDVFFRQGIAAPPIPGNESGLRHYQAQMDVDPQRIVNLDTPLEAQTADVRRALEKMGIRTSDSLLGEPMPVANALWENAIANSPEMIPGGPFFRDSDPAYREGVAKLLAGDGNAGYRSVVEQALGIEPSVRLPANADTLGIIQDTAAATMARQLNDANLPMGVTQGTGFQAGGVYAPPRSDAQMMQEARIFQPSKLEIIRRLAVPGAIGVGAAAGSASADDRYGDGASQFSRPPAPPASQDEQDNSFMGMVGQAGDYLQGKASGAAKYVGDRFSDDLTPEDMAAFQASPTREMRHFHKVVDEAMQMPVVRAGTHTLSPSKYLEVAARASGLSELSVQNAIASIKGLPFDQEDKDAVALRDNLLTQMRTNLPGRYETGAIDTEFDAGATPEQAAEFDKAGPAESRYRLTPQGEQGYQSERAYNLFSTFQNGTHRPIGANNSGKVLASVGGLALDMVGDAQGAGQTYNLAANRFNTPRGRMNEALQWWYTGQPDGTSGDSMGGAKYPSLSSTTLDGVTTKMANADNFLPRYNQQLSERYLYNLDMPAANRAALDQMRDDFYRTTPRYPAGSDPKEVRGLIRELKDLDSEARQYAGVEYPALVQKYGISPEAFGGAPHDFTGRTVNPEKPIPRVKPTYLSQFGEMMVNYPRDMADAQGIAELGLGLATGGTSLLGSLVNERSLAAGAAKTARSVAKGGFKAGSNAVGETPTNWAMAEVNRPAESLGFFDPPEYNPLVTDPAGNPVRADDPNYGTYKQSAYDKRDSRLQRLLDAGTKMYGRSQPAPRRPFDD